MLQKVKIDGKEYEIKKLPKEALDLINTIFYIDRKITEFQNEIKILTAARFYYAQNLNKILQEIEK